MVERYVSAGSWLKAQNGLMQFAKMMLLVGATAVPVSLIIYQDFKIGFSIMGIMTVSSLYLIMLSLVIEPLRTSGIPIFERD